MHMYSIECWLRRGLVAVFVFTLSGVLRADVVFQDTFNDGNVNNSDSITGFWTAVAANGSVAESGGILTSTANSTTVNNPGVNLTSAAQASLNFFESALQFDVNFKVPGIGGTASVSQQKFQFTIASGSNKTAYQADDAISVAFNGISSVTLSAKQNRANLGDDVTFVSQAFQAGPSALKGFRLTLDDADYQLIVYKNDGTVLNTYSGAHGLSLSNWGTGASGLAFLTQRADGITSNDTWSKIEDITVTSIPEPATVSLFGSSLLLVLFARRCWMV